MNLLETITALSHEFGTADYVKGGGGNTSAKNTDTLWVKPSGTTLGSLTPATFIPMDRLRLAILYTALMPAEASAREARVKQIMAGAVQPGVTGRPSVEAPLHDILNGTFVVHTHAVLVNGLTCAAQGAAMCRRMFPAALWVPYIDPGFTLCMDVRRRVAEYQRAHGRPPTVLILENHGIFVAGNSAEEIRAGYRGVIDPLREAYRQAGIATDLRVAAPADPAVVARVAGVIQGLLGKDAAHVVSSGMFAVARGPISPDHVVYAKAYAYGGPLTRDGIEAYRQAWRTTPRVLVTEAGVFGVGRSAKQAQLALELAQDGALLQQLAEAFGGIKFLSVAAREFIENWEVEAYRQRQMQ